jgi:hypothetical protein
MTRVRIDVREIEGLADRLSRVDGRRLGIAAIDTVNEVTTEFQDKSVKGGLENINLSEDYFRGKMKLSLATNGGRPRAEILTFGDLTVLGRFGGTVWYRDKGAPRRAGPVKGRRSAGVYSNVENTQRLDEPQWFLMRLKNQGGLMGAFVRTTALKGKGRNGPGPVSEGRHRDGKYGKEQKYGPSPYSLFKKQIDVQGPQLRRDLESTAVRNLIGEIERVVL